MSKNDKNIGKKILSSFLAFFLAILLTVGTVCISVYVGLFSNERILDGLNYKDYYANVEEFFYQNARDMTSPSGLPPEIVNDIVDAQTIYDDVKGYVLASLKGEEYTFHTDELKENLTKKIYQYFQEENIQITQLQEETIPQYVETVADKYIEDLKVPLVPHIPKIKQIYKKALPGIITVDLLLCTGIVVALFRIHRWRHRGLRYVVYSTTATAIMIALPAFAARKSGFYKRIGINVEHLYNALVAYIENGINMLFYMAAGWLVVTCILLLLISFLKKKGKRRN